MDRLAQLELHTEQLSTAVKSLMNHRHNIDPPESPRAGLDTDRELSNAKASILANVASIKAIVGGPDDLLQGLATQAEILACLQWLAECQILACIPLELSIPTNDLADLAGVPVSQLLRAIRLLATVGFLQEQEPGSVAHTPLSAQFITSQSLLDASVFMAESAVSGALQMPIATQRFGATQGGPAEAAMNSIRSFQSALRERSRLRRQWSAYLRHAAGLHQEEEEELDVISRLNWSNLGSACIVEVNARSTSMARSLAERFPSLRLTVQIDDASAPLSQDSLWHSGPTDIDLRDSRDARMESDAEQRNKDNSGTIPSSDANLNVTYRSAGMPQHVKDAAVYILHLPAARPRPSPGGSPATLVKAELQSYLDLLRTNGSVMLVLTTRLLPEPGSLCGPEVEAVARARDLCMFQLTNEGELELADVLGMIEAVRDNVGRLVVTSQLRSHNNLIVALVVKHQAS
ncbi:hypothetical protein FJTKL_01123 [Diaporthe vaccinii]|uniref:O-methyltransferase n=1 Tax=Diaporthe vaccinii TaxID=105482 RepID=A0ABR4F5L4_9PEZI